MSLTSASLSLSSEEKPRGLCSAHIMGSHRVLSLRHRRNKAWLSQKQGFLTLRKAAWLGPPPRLEKHPVAESWGAQLTRSPNLRRCEYCAPSHPILCVCTLRPSVRTAVNRLLSGQHEHVPAYPHTPWDHLTVVDLNFLNFYLILLFILLRSLSF